MKSYTQTKYVQYWFFKNNTFAWNLLHDNKPFLSFLAGNSVEVDESLFQDMDDLELDEGDPDFDSLDLGSDDDD